MPRNQTEAYKLFEIDDEGNLYSLFINKREPLPVDRWLTAENHPTKGFAVRPGWHCCSKIDAPHLKLSPKNGRQRVWAKVEVQSYKIVERPASQGGTWYLAKRIRITELLPEATHDC